MKRILSIILCVAMLSSMVSMAVSAVGELEDQVTTENVMSITTDKDSYKAGDTVTITASMESIWGDYALEGNIEGYDDVMPGAYGMNILCANLIYDTSVFTAKVHKSLLGSSTIVNADAAEASVSGNNPIEAKANGAYYLMAESDIYNANYDGYGFFSGSGDLWTWNLTIAADAAPGTYYLPVGPYVITDTQTEGKNPVVKFADEGLNDRYWAWLGNPDSLLIDREVTYKTNYDGPSRVDTTDEVTGKYGTEYECSYVAIKIEADLTEEDITNAAAVDSLIDAIGDVQNSGAALTIDSYNNDALYTHTGDTDGIVGDGVFSINFKMMPGINTEDKFGFFGGWTEWNSGADVIFWNNAESKFMIGQVDGPVNASEVNHVRAESEALDLPDNKWTEVEFIYNGSYMAVKVNGAIVCETNNASTGYSFFIFYPSGVKMNIADMDIDGYDYDEFLAGYNANAYIKTALDSGAAIAAAREAYEALSVNAKSAVTKLDVLKAAEAEYAEIADYYANIIINKAINLIDSIGTVTYPNSLNAIVAAEEYVATLTEAQLALVTNYDTLTAARAEYNRREGLYNQAKADYVIGLIDAIGEVTFDSRAAIELAEKEYSLLTDGQKALVSNYDVLVAAREAYNLYAPVMNAENMINALGTKLYQGNVTHFDAANIDTVGYYNFPDVDTDNNTYGLEFSFDFMYVDANKTDKGANIGGIRNGNSFVGYDFKTMSFVISGGGGFYNGSNGVCDIVAQKEYNLLPNRWYNMTIKYEDNYIFDENGELADNPKAGMASVYLDGELMVEGTPADTNYAFYIFYPQQVSMYIGENNLTFGATYPHPFSEHPMSDPAAYAFPGAGGSRDYYKLNTGIDVISPVDFGAKIQAAEDAVAALTDEQAALLDASYTEALAAFKADYEAKYAEVVANAEKVEALIDAITDDASIIAARDAYQALTAGAKALVENYAALEAANASLAVKAIDAIGVVTPASDSAIFAAESAYYALTEAERALVTNYQVMVDARAELTALNAAVAKAEAAIDMLQAGGSAIYNPADNGSAGSYSQFLDNAENLAGNNANDPYAFSFDVYVTEITDATNSFFGGSSANEVFVGYDFVRGTVFVAKAGPWGYNSACESIVAEADFDLQLNTWYDFKFVMGDATAEIYVDGELVLETAITEPTGWFIYYPRNNNAYYDNVEFWYNGEQQTAMANFTRTDAGNWTALAGCYSVASDAPVGAIKYDADVIAAARAAYDAVPEKAQYAVSNYDILVAAEAGPEPEIPEVPATDITGLSVQSGIESVDVSWDALENVVKYWVYVDGKVVASTTDNAITLAVKAGEHQITVSAAVRDTAGKIYYGAMSEAVVVEVEAEPVVELVVNATATENSITAEWNAIDGAIYYVTFNVDGTDIVVKTTNTSITLAKYVTADTAYTVTVKALVAVDGGYEVTESNVFEGVTAAASFQVVATNDGFTWTEVEGATIYWAEITTVETGKTSLYKYTSVSEKTLPVGYAFDVTVTAFANGEYFVAQATVQVEQIADAPSVAE